MEKRPVGRPKKENAIKSGELKEGECRFTFITTYQMIDAIKNDAIKEGVKIKEYIKKVFDYYYKKNKKQNHDKRTTQTIAKVKRCNTKATI